MKFYNFINEKEDIRKEIILLIGLPASGKSTYISKMKGKYTIVSNDLYTEKIAKKLKITYAEAFKKINKNDTLNNTRKEFDKALSKGRNIIVDNTNMTIGQRSYYTKSTSEDYKKIALIFKIDDAELKKRLEKRGEDTGKVIPWEVIERMKKIYQPPTKKEGFDEIKKIS